MLLSDAEPLLHHAYQACEEVVSLFEVGKACALPPPSEEVLEAGAGQEALVARAACAGGLDGIYSLNGAVDVKITFFDNHNSILGNILSNIWSLNACIIISFSATSQ